MNPQQRSVSEHPEGLLVRYLEGSLPSQDNALVRTHLEVCAACAKELEGLKEICQTLEMNREALCPEPWELYDFVNYGVDPSGKISKHVDQCAFCHEETISLKPLPESVAIPESVRSKAIEALAGRSTIHQASARKELFSDTAEAPALPEAAIVHQASAWKEPFSDFWSGFSSLFNVPVLAAATAAAVLIVVLVYPDKMPKSPSTPAPGQLADVKAKPALALSSVKWDQGDEDIQLMSPVPVPDKPDPEKGPIQKRRVAMLIFFENTPHPFKQERIDRLYEALKPTADVNDRYNVLTPDEVREAVGKGQVKGETKDQILRGLQDKLGVSDAVFITIAAAGDKFGVESELVDLMTGNLVRRTATGVRESQLPLKVREVSALLD